VGRFLVESFLKDGHEVLAAYRTMNPGLQQVRCKKVQVDLMYSLDGLEPVDIIIHAAAAHVNSNPVPDLNSYIHSNVIATKHMADYAAAGRTQLFIYLSTVSVYGAVEGGVLSEGTPVNSPNMYGASKYMAELILKEYQQQFPSICVRLPGITGKGSLNLWLGSVMERAIKGQPIKIYNGDSMFNNVVDRADLMRFVSACIDREDWSFNIFNLAASNPITVREVVKLIISLTGSNSEIVEKEVSRESFFISNEKLRNVLDFVPETTGTLVSRFVRANLESTKFNHDAVRHGHLKEINK
jgi:nucleoside-diphosphate-sugar epimerase